MMVRSAFLHLQRWLECRAPFFSTRIAVISSLLWMALYATDVTAGSFSVNPVRIELSPNQSSAVIQVDNNGSNEVTVEAKILSWSQADGKELLSPSRELIVTPQIFRMKPGAMQILRVGALRKTDPEREISYRLMLEEIPPPPNPDTRGLQVALRVSMPVFLKPHSAKEKIDPTLKMETPQQLRLSLANSGNASAHFSTVTLFYEDEPDTAIASHTLSTYVLAGQKRDILLKTSAIDPEKKILIKAKTYAGPLEFHAISVLR